MEIIDLDFKVYTFQSILSIHNKCVKCFWSGTTKNAFNGLDLKECIYRGLLLAFLYSLFRKWEFIMSHWTSSSPVSGNLVFHSFHWMVRLKHPMTSAEEGPYKIFFPFMQHLHHYTSRAVNNFKTFINYCSNSRYYSLSHFMYCASTYISACGVFVSHTSSLFHFLFIVCLCTYLSVVFLSILLLQSTCF